MELPEVRRVCVDDGEVDESMDCDGAGRALCNEERELRDFFWNSGVSTPDYVLESRVGSVSCVSCDIGLAVALSRR